MDTDSDLLRGIDRRTRVMQRQLSRLLKEDRLVQELVQHLETLVQADQEAVEAVATRVTESVTRLEAEIAELKGQGVDATKLEEALNHLKDTANAIAEAKGEEPPHEEPAKEEETPPTPPPGE